MTRLRLPQERAEYVHRTLLHAQTHRAIVTITHPEYRVRLPGDGTIHLGMAVQGEWADLFYSCLEAFADVYGLSDKPTADDEPMIDRMVREAKERLHDFIQELTNTHKAEMTLTYLAKQPWFYSMPKYQSARAEYAAFNTEYRKLVEQRLQAKKDGDKRLEALLRLQLNKKFGKFVDYIDPRMYEPTITVEPVVRQSRTIPVYLEEDTSFWQSLRGRFSKLPTTPPQEFS